MTECNGCGSCCDPVIAPYSQSEVYSLSPAEMHPENRRWVLEDLTPMSETEARAIEPEFYADLVVAGRPHLYRCKNFDRDKRACMIYDQRPPICHQFPWLSGEPDPMTLLPPACSFRADIGQPVFLELHKGLNPR